MSKISYPGFEDQLKEHVPQQSELFTHKNILIFGIASLSFLVLTVIIARVIVGGKSEEQSKTTIIAKIQTTPTPTPLPPVSLTGELDCIATSPPGGGARTASCNVVLTAENGTKYVIENLSKNDLIKQNLAKKTVKINGVITSSSSNTTISASSVNGTQIPTSTPPPAGGPTATPLPTSTPTPTPTPPPNVQKIIDATPGNNGQILNVYGLLVTGNIGEEACLFMGICDHSEIIINDSVAYDRNTAYDTTVKLSSSEKESDYFLGQYINIQAKVVVNPDGSVTLEKIY